MGRVNLRELETLAWPFGVLVCRMCVVLLKFFGAVHKSCGDSCDMGYVDLNRVEKLVDRLVYLQTSMRVDVTSTDIGGWIQEVCNADGFECEPYHRAGLGVVFNFMRGIEKVFVIKKDNATRYVQVKKIFDPILFSGFSVSFTSSPSDFWEGVGCCPRPDVEMVKQDIRRRMFVSFGLECPA
jgi:hypothetical protein